VDTVREIRAIHILNRFGASHHHPIAPSARRPPIRAPQDVEGKTQMRRLPRIGQDGGLFARLLYRLGLIVPGFWRLCVCYWAHPIWNHVPAGRGSTKSTNCPVAIALALNSSTAAQSGATRHRECGPEPPSTSMGIKTRHTVANLNDRRTGKPPLNAGRNSWHTVIPTTSVS